MFLNIFSMNLTKQMFIENLKVWEQVKHKFNYSKIIH